MTVQRIKITLEGPEYSALLGLAKDEVRPLEHQARYMLRKDLERRGRLPADSDHRRVMEERSEDDTRNES